MFIVSYLNSFMLRHINDILLWTPTHGCACIGWPAKTYLHQFRVDMGCNLEDLLDAKDDMDGESESQGNSYSQDDLRMTESVALL